MSKERNAEICYAYAVQGLTLQECGDKYGLTKERIRQILRAEGVFKNARPKKQKVGLSDGLVESDSRDVFLGINISESDKLALRVEAQRRGLSMSRLSSDFIKEMLEGLKNDKPTETVGDVTVQAPVHDDVQ